MGVNATQDELASLAGTDEIGTTMYGLVHAAQSKGLNATGMILSVDQLKPNYIVLLITANGLHYSVITSITNDTVYLADSSFGNINMTLEDFTAIYSGYALIITSNSTNNSTNNTINGTILTNEQMQNIKGTSNVVTTLFGGAIAIGEIGIGTLCAGAAAVFGIGVIFAQPVGIGEDAYWDNWRRTHTKHNTIYVGSGGYSYSYKHGYNPRSIHPVHIPYIPPTYTYSLYVATPTGWEYKTFTTTSNPAILKDQQIYKQYQIKKASELAKIAGISGFYLNQTWTDWNYQKQIDKAIADKTLTTGSNGDPKDLGEFFLNLYKKSMKKINSGRAELRAGNYKGIIDITIGTGGLTLWGPSLSSYLIYELWPQGLWPKTSNNESTNSTMN